MKKSNQSEHQKSNDTSTTPDDEIVQFMKVPIKLRLLRLEEFKRFVAKCAPEKSQELWRMFRSGEL